MNTALSLLIYNPLEALCLMKFCDFFLKRKLFNKNDFIICYLLGSINFIVQKIPNLFENKFIIFFMDLIVSFIAMPLILFIFYNMFYSHRMSSYRFRIFFSCCLFNFSLSLFCITILNKLFDYIYNVGYSCIMEELAANLLLRFINFMIIGVAFYVKKVFRKNS